VTLRSNRYSPQRPNAHIVGRCRAVAIKKEESTGA